MLPTIRPLFSSSSGFRYAFIMLILPTCGDIESNPGPRRCGSCYNFTICHWNLNSMTAHSFEKINLLEAYNTIKKFDVICLSESKLDCFRYYIKSSAVYHIPGRTLTWILCRMSIGNTLCRWTGYFSRNIWRSYDKTDSIKNGQESKGFKENIWKSGSLTSQPCVTKIRIKIFWMYKSAGFQ